MSNTLSTEAALPTDDYSITLSRMQANPAAIERSSTVHAITMLGHSETWVITTVRVEGGQETVFLQRINAAGGLRLVLPPAVAATIARQRDGAVTVARRRSARKAVETRKERGIVPAFLKGKRKARGK